MNGNDFEKNEIKGIKTDRVIELFFRAVKGESLSPQKLADEYHVSTRSITRDINNLKIFLSEHMDILGYSELEYSSVYHCYTLKMEHFLTNKELVSVAKVLIGSRAFNHQELLEIMKKLKQNTTSADRTKLDALPSFALSLLVNRCNAFFSCVVCLILVFHLVLLRHAVEFVMLFFLL